jgi:site-specific DNA-methyltransferase (adenine-specific)
MTTNEIWHGDSIKLAADLPSPIHCLITDPPYGIDFESNSVRRGASADEYNDKIDNDGDVDGALEVFQAVMEHVAPKLADDADVYVFTDWTVAPQWSDAMADMGLPVSMQLIWEKGYPGLGDLTYNWGCGYEVILYCKKGRRPVNHRRRGVISIPRVPSGKNIHPTEKPVALIEELIKVSTNPGDMIVDPFSGSGSTTLAAQRTGRNCIGIEKSKKYVTKSQARLEQVGFAWAE